MKIIHRIMYAARKGSSEVGNRTGVIKIDYHAAQGEGDRHYCTVYYDDGEEVRIFDIDEIVWRRTNVEAPANS